MLHASPALPNTLPVSSPAPPPCWLGGVSAYPQEAARLEKHVKEVSAREDRNEAALVRLQQKLGALRVKASTVEIRSMLKHEERKAKTGRSE